MLGFPGGANGKEIMPLLPVKERQETLVPSLGWKDPLEKEIATHPSISCLENSMDKGAWWATVQRVTKSWIQLSMYFLDTSI